MGEEGLLGEGEKPSSMTDGVTSTVGTDLFSVSEDPREGMADPSGMDGDGDLDGVHRVVAGESLGGVDVAGTHDGAGGSSATTGSGSKASLAPSSNDRP